MESTCNIYYLRLESSRYVTVGLSCISLASSEFDHLTIFAGSLGFAFFLFFTFDYLSVDFHACFFIILIQDEAFLLSR